MSTDRNAPQGAVVLGGDFHGLGIARSLGRRGIPVCIIDDEYSIGRFSKYVARTVPAPIRQEADIVEALRQVGRRFGLQGWVLYPTRDELVAAIARHRTELSEWYRVPTPDFESIKWAWNKWYTFQLASRLGIPTPRTWCPKTTADLDAIDAPFPLGVKPAVKEHFFYATKAKAWMARNRAELVHFFEKAQPHMAGHEILVQEFIPGDGDQQYSSCVFFKNGRALGTMEARRWRQHPPEFGRAATFVETVDAPELLVPTLKFLDAMQYYGLAEIEYKRDARDGQFKLIDVNTRTWGFHSLGPSAGVDFVHMLFADQMGKAVQECRGRPGVGWIRMVTDIPTSLREIIAGRLNWSGYLKSLRDFTAESAYDPTDLAPSIVELALLPYLAAKRGF